jgi:transcriptional regulator with XRE-family HTH domain
VQEVETRDVLQFTPAPRKSGLAGYLEGLRAQIQRHFGSSEVADPSARTTVDPITHGQEARETSVVEETLESPAMPAALPPSRFPALRKGGSSPAAQHSAELEQPAKPQEASGRSAVSAKSHELAEKPTPRPFGRHLGQKVRQRRWMLGLSREQLGNRLGLTIEQIARYETGKAEIDSTRLWDIATVLQVPIRFFFEGLDDQAKSECAARADILSDEEAHLRQGFSSQDTILFSSSRSA